MKKIMLAVCLMTGITAQSAQAVGWKKKATTFVMNAPAYAKDSPGKTGGLIVVAGISIYLAKKGLNAIQAWRNQSAPMTEEQKNTV